MSEGTPETAVENELWDFSDLVKSVVSGMEREYTLERSEDPDLSQVLAMADNLGLETSGLQVGPEGCLDALLGDTLSSLP